MGSGEGTRRCSRADSDQQGPPGRKRGRDGTALGAEGGRVTSARRNAVTNAAPHTGVSKESGGKGGHVEGLGGAGRWEVETLDGPQPRKVGIRGWPRGKQTWPMGLTENPDIPESKSSSPAWARHSWDGRARRSACKPVCGACARARPGERPLSEPLCTALPFFPFYCSPSCVPYPPGTTTQPSVSCCFKSH